MPRDLSKLEMPSKPDLGEEEIDDLEMMGEEEEDLEEEGMEDEESELSGISDEDLIAEMQLRGLSLEGEEDLGEEEGMEDEEDLGEIDEDADTVNPIPVL